MGGATLDDVMRAMASSSQELNFNLTVYAILAPYLLVLESCRTCFQAIIINNSRIMLLSIRVQAVCRLRVPAHWGHESPFLLQSRFLCQGRHGQTDWNVDSPGVALMSALRTDGKREIAHDCE